MKKTRLAVVAVVAAALTLTACSGGSNAGASGDGPNAIPQKGGVVSFLASPDFSHLDPATGFDGGVNNFYRLIYRTLTTPAAGKDGAKIVPDLATSLGKANSDATVWTFTLKDGIYFQDGKPITSQDVKFGVERAFDPALGIGSPYAKLYLADSENYKGPYQGSGGGLSSIETPNK
jgi:peptide/nickel transport system substrate-binding protein